MYIKSPYPDPPPLPNVNAHNIFFKRPDQAEWPNYTVHINPVESIAAAKGSNGAATTPSRVMFRDFLSTVEDLSTGLTASVADGGLALKSWPENVQPERVGIKGSHEIVGIMSENSSEYIALVHACIRVALPFALLSSYSTPFELKHILTLSKATRIFVDAKFLPIVLPVCKELGLSSDRIYLMAEGGAKAGKPGKAKKGGKERSSFRSIIENVRKRKLPTVDVSQAGKDTLAYLVFSSGTSGLPKAVMISHGNLIYSVGQALVLQAAIQAVYIAPPPKNPEGLPTTLAFLPLHHTYGLHAYCFRAFLAQSTLVLLPKWDINVALDAIPRYKVSGMPLIPSLVHQLVHHPGVEKTDFSSIQQLGSGAAYLPPELGEKLTKLVPAEAVFTEGYGMSEATIAAISQPLTGMMGGKLKRVPGSSGVLLPGMEARLMKGGDDIPPKSHDTPSDADCALNEPGDLWVRAPNVALGYWNNPKANKETFIDGWLKTGDRFKYDGNNFWFADRAKDTLKVSGAQVSPVEIEDCLLAQPDGIITDATVAGVSGGRTSDEKIPRAWVVLSVTGKSWGEEKVIAALDKWHKDNLSKYKWLRGGIEIVDEIPKSPTGKTLRRVLQDKYEAHVKKSRGKPKAKL